MASSMEINVDTESLIPKRPSKRCINSSDDVSMEVVNGIEGKIKNKSDPKRRKTAHQGILRVAVPAHRYTPLKENWIKIFTPLVEHLQLQVRFNLKTRNVEIRTTEDTKDIGNAQKGADFVKAFVYGFEVEDALALLRLENLFVETFEIKDVRTLKGDHQSRAIGRLAGKGGKTKFSIENATKTRIVLADSRIHILGSYENIQLARKSICSLIIGAPPSKVYGQLQSVLSTISARI